MVCGCGWWVFQGLLDARDGKGMGFVGNGLGGVSGLGGLLGRFSLQLSDPLATYQRLESGG